MSLHPLAVVWVALAAPSLAHTQSLASHYAPSPAPESGPGAAPSAVFSSSLLPTPPPAVAASDKQPLEPYAAIEPVRPLSRLGIGADISPLGVGIKSAVDLTPQLDARLMANYFNYVNGRIEVDGFNIYGRLHLASGAAALDWYPFASVWRLSIGTLFVNQNHASVALNATPGTSFTLNGQTFYSANPNPIIGATPLSGAASLAFHTNRPALTLSGGFARFIPQQYSHRWSFPAEFGVAFTGPPALNVTPSGWVCQDQQQTQCANIADTTNPVGASFNQSLQTVLTKDRRSLSGFRVYPLFSYSVVYSFNFR
jgi:hypothetical protein